MLALRLTRSARPAVQLRRLLVATASAGTGFLLLCTLGHALGHPDTPAGSALRLAWCTVPLAATVHFALAVARTDPGTRPRPGLAAIGLGPARLMAISATTTALSTAVGSMLALLLFLHLRGDLTGMPFDGAAASFLAADIPLPLPAALTLLALAPAASSLAVALTLRPRDTRLAANSRGTGLALRRFTTTAKLQETFGAYGRFGSRQSGHDAAGRSGAGDTPPPLQAAGARAAGAARVGAGGVPSRGVSAPAPGSVPRSPVLADGPRQAPADVPITPLDAPVATPPDPPRPNPTTLPWGAALLAAGLAVEAYASRSPGHHLTLPGGPTGPAAVLLGWTLTAIGLAVAGPSLTHLCGRLLQAARPGALRLLAGRGLMEEASRIGAPLGILCAVASGAYTMAVLYDPADSSFGPLTTLGAALVAGCALATLLTAAVEARQARAATTAALLRLGAPSTALRSAAALRAGALAAMFVPLTLTVAALAALPLTP
ncbi:hypothetical protein NFX46_08100 [Streptomyces phaeoluteigriseus]|uniref:Integral membrane protein n=1 Tax=Streptomyces phaeoluteigriseus TaxID=114686 RepID=A0ABY4Z616_9ACTN|nr:hypothetical protein [Streptomyces phaeoluteigriseus]USQ83757.1 hypothetical protein NFX46_08100 [Streptomyces phaeoluteigriseus]